MNGKYPPHHPVALLRASLSEGEDKGRATEVQRRAAVEAARPLVDSLYKMLLLYCDHLVRESALRERMDGADLAQDTWVKVLRYLSGPGGDRVQDETHLRCLLRLSAKRRLLDLLEQERERRRVEQSAPETWDNLDSGSGNTRETPLESYEDIQATREMKSALGFLADGPYCELVTALFENDAAFRKISQHPVRRKSKHYQAFVVCQMGAFLRREARRDVTDNHGKGSLDEESVWLMREFAKTLGIPAEIWRNVEQAVRQAPPCTPGDDGISPELLEVVNRTFDVDLQIGNYMSVLKHELNKFAGR